MPLALIEGATLTATIITSFEGIVTQTVDIMAGVAPAAISVFAITYLWKKAKGFFTSL